MALVQKTFKKRTADELDETTDQQEHTANQGVARLEQVVERPPAPLPVLVQPTENRDIQTLGQYRDEIHALWHTAAESFVRIGRLLNDAKKELPHGQFTSLVDEQLPFGKSVCHALRSIADAVDSKLVLENELPGDYTAAYQVVSLPESLVQQAREQGILRPTVTRREIVEFKKTARQAASQPAAAEDDKSLLRQRIKLKTKLERIAAQRRLLNKDEAELNTQLQAVETKLAAGQQGVD